MNQRERPEPELGRIEDLDTEMDARPTGSGRRPPNRVLRRRAVRHWPWLVVLVLVVAAAVIYQQREQLRMHFPGSQTRELLNAAARAETDQRWHVRDGQDHALALYLRVLDGDPDNDAARLGLSRVGEHLAIDAEAAMAADDEDEAERLLRTMAEIGMPGERVAALRTQLEGRQVMDHELVAMLDSAQTALERRRIRGDQGALALFRQMLLRDPDNAVARRGIEDALGVLLEEAAIALAEGGIDRAEELTEMVAAEQAQHASLPALRQAIAEARAQQAAIAQAEIADVEISEPEIAELQSPEIEVVDAQIAQEQAELDAEQQARAQAQAEQAERAAEQERIAQAQAQAERDAEVERVRQVRELERKLELADRQYASGRLDQALSSYRQAQDLAPEHPAPRAGLARIANDALAEADLAIDESDPPRAEAALRIAARADADATQLARGEAALAALSERLAAVLARPELDLEQQQRLDTLMARARAADDRGQLVEPVGASAYDLYRQVLAIDPMHEEARRGAMGLPRRAQALVVHRIEVGQLESAVDAFNALLAMAPMDPVLPELRRQLANAWLEHGSEAARAGADVDARRALERARALVPQHPGIAVLARELGGG